MSKGTCATPECDRGVYYRNLCRPHYSAERGYKRARETFDCEDCGQPHSRGTSSRPKRCPSCARRAGQALRYAAKPGPTCTIRFPECQACGLLFCTRAANAKYCSTKCRPKSARPTMPCRGCGGLKELLDSFCGECKRERLATSRRAWRAKRPKGLETHRRRARHFGVEYEPIDKAKVYERDAWTCGICGDAIDPSAHYPDLMSASLDHIKPLSKGGGHTYTNVQASHFICNSLKGARALVAAG